ncbi:MAG: DegT/DnrJ/EryC1/StrS family aminotransferase, partial [Campylobacterales bacterium]|nr:DegT/DnrJ/EryC1/StrS family aminotransferase [Campylobacterales bacterium]
ENNILARRYFYPSLDTLDYLQNNQACLVSRDIACRILSLPIYPGMKDVEQEKVIKVFKKI